MPPHPSLTRLLELYRQTLLHDVVPFWIEHGLDPAGGINTCVTDDGAIVSRDRWCWSQWRAVWVFSRLYNQLEPRPEWLDAARQIFAFVARAGTVERGHWPLLLDEHGRVKRGYESIYVDGFAIYGLVELWRATRDERLLQLAMRTFAASDSAIRDSAPPPAWPYPIPPGRMAHGVSMLFSLVYHELAEAAPDRAVRESALWHHRQVMQRFLHPARSLVREWLDARDEPLPPPEGTVVVPGHAIESMWMQMHVAREDDQVTQRATEAILRHLEIGWDQRFEGILLAVDADGRDPVGWSHADTKLWWPHTEALYATLLAYERTADDRFLQWHERVRSYAYRHYPTEHGEWRQKLDRQGRPIERTLFLPVKDPFHLPRSLMFCIDVLQRVCGTPSVAGESPGDGYHTRQSPGG